MARAHSEYSGRWNASIDSGATFSSMLAVYGTRTSPVAYGTIGVGSGAFIFAAGEYDEYVSPAASVELPLHNLRLEHLLMGEEKDFYAPSNPFFLPAEYATLNCCICPGNGAPSAEMPCTKCYPDPPPNIAVSLQPSTVQPGEQTTVKVTTDPGRSISLSRSEVTNSGGHQHAGRPLGVFGQSQGVADFTGVFVTTYTASVYGGKETIKASSGFLNDSATLNVAITGLVLLSPGSNYILAGANNWHPGNNYGTSGANQHLVDIANQYAAQFPGSKLQYNDQSLLQGGLFDVNYNWNTPHAEHRLGLNCDVYDGNVPTNRWAQLEMIFSRNGSPNFLPEHDKGHWHLRF